MPDIGFSFTKYKERESTSIMLDETEKISLREEAEMVEIRNSVKLDFENKKIICSLPLRGKEEDFLTSNRDRCVKVLDQQCSKYFSDVKTRVF